MKKLAILVGMVFLFGLSSIAYAGDFHVGGSLICSDCHVAHYSQSHAYTSGGIITTLGPSGPYLHLLRNDVNDLCLTCHDGQSGIPDVFGANGGTAHVRLAGGLNAATGYRTNDAGYDLTDGHTLWSSAVAPGGTFSNPTGLECVDCHAQHGIATQYRNLLNRGAFAGHNITYAVGANDLTKDVFERSAASYAIGDVDYNEPSTSASAYANWCKSCHTSFHGVSGGPEVGGASGGGTGWLRHPQADVNIGQNATFISSLSQFNGHTNRVKVMDSQGLWNGLAADNTVTPSCFSCHKSHGNMNTFGLIFMSGTGTVTEEGDGGQLRDLCRQCHVEGA